MLGLGIVDVAVGAPVPGGTALAAVILQGTRAVTIQVAPTPHPDPFVRAGIQGPNVLPPSITDDALTVVEQPWHPRPFAWYGVQGPDAQVPVTSFVSIRQEQPWHPGPIFRWNQPVNVAAEGQITDRVIVVQEQPWQPLWPRPPIMPGYTFITRIGSAKGYILG